MKYILLSTVLFTSVAFANTFKLENLKKSLRQDGRAELSVSTYNTNLINWNKEVKVLMDKHKSCGEPEVSTGERDSIAELKGFYDEYALANTLQNLFARNRIAYSIFVKDATSDNDPENCSTGTFQFYSKDGEVLTIYFDYNT